MTHENHPTNLVSYPQNRFIPDTRTRCHSRPIEPASLEMRAKCLFHSQMLETEFGGSSKVDGRVFQHEWSFERDCAKFVCTARPRFQHACCAQCLPGLFFCPLSIMNQATLSWWFGLVVWGIKPLVLVEKPQLKPPNHQSKSLIEGKLTS